MCLRGHSLARASVASRRRTRWKMIKVWQNDAKCTLQIFAARISLCKCTRRFRRCLGHLKVLAEAELFVSLSLILNKVSCLVFVFVPWVLHTDTHTQHISWNAAELHGHLSYSSNARVVCRDDVLDVMDHFLYVVLKTSKHSETLVDYSVYAVTIQHGWCTRHCKASLLLRWNTGAWHSCRSSLFFRVQENVLTQCISCISLNSEPAKTTAVIPVSALHSVCAIPGAFPLKPLKLFEALFVTVAEALKPLKPFDASEAFWRLWSPLTPLKPFDASEAFWRLWRLLTPLTPFDASEAFWRLWSLLTPLTPFDASEAFWRLWRPLTPLKPFDASEAFWRFVWLRWLRLASFGFAGFVWLRLASLASFGFVWLRLASFDFAGFVWLRWLRLASFGFAGFVWPKSALTC